VSIDKSEGSVKERLSLVMPSGSLIDGKASQPKVQATVRSGPVNLGLASAKEPD